MLTGQLDVMRIHRIPMKKVIIWQSVLSVVQVMVCGLFHAKPLPEPMPCYDRSGKVGKIRDKLFQLCTEKYALPEICHLKGN